MKKLLSIVALLWSMTAFAQEIAITKDGLTINSQKLTNASTYKDVVKLLGKPEKEDKTEEEDIRLRYASGGLQVYLSPTATKTLKTIIVKLEQGSTSENVFAGKLVLNGLDITANSHRSVVENMPGLIIKHNGDTGIDAQAEGYDLSFYYGDSSETLKRVNIYVDPGEEE